MVAVAGVVGGLELVINLAWSVERITDVLGYLEIQISWNISKIMCIKILWLSDYLQNAINTTNKSKLNE